MSMNATKRWRAVVLAAVAAVSFGLAGGLAGCTDETPVENPGTEQEDGEQEDGEQEDDDDGY